MLTGSGMKEKVLGSGRVGSEGRGGEGRGGEGGTPQEKDRHTLRLAFIGVKNC